MLVNFEANEKRGDEKALILKFSSTLGAWQIFCEGSVRRDVPTIEQPNRPRKSPPKSF